MRASAAERRDRAVDSTSIAHVRVSARSQSDRGPDPRYELAARQGRGRAMPDASGKTIEIQIMANTIDLRGLVRPQLVESTKREDNPNVAEFRLQPLERGFGHTLGNAMRRMLLSSLRGSAVWGFRIDGVVHEHQTIPGVVEDVHQIIGNLKTLTLSLRRRRRRQPSFASPRAVRPTSPPATSSARPVFGSSIPRIISSRCRTTATSTSSCTSTTDAATSSPISTSIDRALPVDLVRIDSIYNPVRRANFTVAETRVGQRTDYDRLTLTVETNGTITPEEAVSYAAALAQTHFQYFAGFGSHASAPIAAGGELGGDDAARLGSVLSRRRSTISSCRCARSTRSRTATSARLAISCARPKSQILARQELRKEVAERDRRSARARESQFRHAVRGERADGSACASLDRGHAAESRRRGWRPTTMEE